MTATTQLPERDTGSHGVDSWECLACGAMRPNASGTCPTCGMDAATVPGNLYHPPGPVHGNRVEDPVAREKARRRDRIIGACLAGVAIFSVGHAIPTNFSPSEAVTRWSGYLWFPIGIVFFLLVLVRISRRRETVSVWDHRTDVIRSLLYIMALSNLAFSYGFPSLVNRMLGAPFEAHALVTEKDLGRWPRPFLVYVQGYAAPLGGLSVDETEWQVLQKGDSVSLSGVSSSWGRSVYSVKKHLPVRGDGIGRMDRRSNTGQSPEHRLAHRARRTHVS